MPQRFVYGCEKIIDSLKELSYKGVPDLTWRDMVFGRYSFKSFPRKASNLADVFYINTLKGSVPFNLNQNTGYENSPLSLMNSHISSDLNNLQIDVSGIEVYAVDPSLNIRGWTRKTHIGEKNPNPFADSFAKCAVDLFGKAVVVNSFSGEGAHEIVSIYFPRKDFGHSTRVISKCEEAIDFRLDLDMALTDFLTI